ncbi:hypothetical protein BV25DRAFT_1920729, partial [Artomyces pyxidatus]
MVGALKFQIEDQTAKADSSYEMPSMDMDLLDAVIADIMKRNNGDHAHETLRFEKGDK